MVGVTLLVGCGVEGVVVGCVVAGLVVVGWSPDVGVVVGSVEDRVVSPGLGVSAA
jgi:hypothetical protein